jgi:hypothetical protein
MYFLLSKLYTKFYIVVFIGTLFKTRPQLLENQQQLHMCCLSANSSAYGDGESVAVSKHRNGGHKKHVQP